MSKGGKVPHNKANIPNFDGGKNEYLEKNDQGHGKDAKHNNAHSHGLKGASSTKSPNHK